MVKQHGTLYVSPNFVCFRSKVFGKVTKYVVPVTEVSEVSLIADSTLVLHRGKKRKPIKLQQVQRGEAAAEMLNKLVVRVNRPEREVRAQMSRRGEVSRRTSSGNGASSSTMSDESPSGNG